MKVKELEGYEGLYTIDDLGNIVGMPNRYTGYKTVVMKTRVNKFGYVQIILCKGGKPKTFLVHRLLAQHFIPNPDNLPQVNHKNGNKADNRIENLEWVTRSQNHKHLVENNLSGYRDTIFKHLDKINSKKAYTKVIVSKDGQTQEFNSTKETAEFLNTDKDNVSRAIQKKHRLKGYTVIGIRNANGES